MSTSSGEWLILIFASIVCFLLFAIRAAIWQFSWSRLDETVKDRAKRQKIEEALARRAVLLSICTLFGLLAEVTMAVVIALKAEAWVWKEPQAVTLWPRSFALALLFAAPAILVLGWVLPGLLARRYSEKIVAISVPWLAYGLNSSKRLWRAILRRRKESSQIAREADAPLNPERETDHTDVDHDVLRLYRVARRFRKATVSEIMTRRTEIVFVNDEWTLERARQVFAECRHSRLPVYHENRDNIVGILNAMDLLRLAPEEWRTTKLTELMRKPVYVPESKEIGQLLEEFQRDKIHLAIVLDEYGGTAGLVSIEDILEELVGEIGDEYDAEEEIPIRRLDARTSEVAAWVRIAEVNETLDINLPETGDYDTVGGFISYTIGRIPRVGEQFRYGNMRITILAADERKVNRVKLEILDKEENPPQKLEIY